MASLIREERYIFQVETEADVLRVQEMVWGSDPWPEKFRVQVPASSEHGGKTFYGSTAQEAAERGVEYITSPVPAIELAACMGARAND
jgi:hypothetical protein